MSPAFGIAAGACFTKNALVQAGQLAVRGVEGGVQLREVADAAVGLGGRIVGELEAFAVDPDAVDAGRRAPRRCRRRGCRRTIQASCGAAPVPARACANTAGSGFPRPNSLSITISSK